MAGALDAPQSAGHSISGPWLCSHGRFSGPSIPDTALAVSACAPVGGSVVPACPMQH